MDDRKAFGERIAHIAKLVGGANELARLSGVSRRTIGAYMAAETDATREKMIALAEAAGISVEWLVTGHGAPRASGGAECAVCPRPVSPSEADQRASQSRLLETARTVRNEENLRLIRQLGLEDIALSARRGTQDLRWHVLVHLLRHGPSSLEDLGVALARAETGHALAEILAELTMLEKGRVITSSEGRYSLVGAGDSFWATQEGDISQACREAIRAITQTVLPRAQHNDGSGILLTFEACVPIGQEREFIGSIFRTLDTARKGDYPAPCGSVTIVFAAATHQMASETESSGP